MNVLGWLVVRLRRCMRFKFITATKALGARTCIFWAPNDYSAVDRRGIEDDRGGHWGAGIGSCLRDYVYEYTR